MDRVVLDTNCLIAILSKRGAYFNVWRSLQLGKFTLCVSNDILLEYEEVIARKTNAKIASNVVWTINNSPFVEFVTPHFRFNLIQSDPDDNKFVDCAIAANAHLLVSNDSHFGILNDIAFPRVYVVDIATFAQRMSYYLS